MLTNTSSAPSASTNQDEQIALWLRIVIGIVVFIYFEVGYLWGQRGHEIATSYYGNSEWDALVPLIPEFIVPYTLGYIFVFVPMLLFKSKQDYYWGASIFILAMSAAFLIFKFFPVYMDKEYATGSDIFSRLTFHQQDSDTNYNNCPSLHVSLNLYCWALLFMKFGRPMLWLIWMPLTIMASTVLVKQHLLIDVVAGIVFGGAVSALFYFCRHKLANSLFWGRWLYRLCLLVIVVVLAMNVKHMARAFELFSMFVAEGSSVIIAAIVLTVVAVLGVRYIQRRQHKGEPVSVSEQH